MFSYKLRVGAAANLCALSGVQQGIVARPSNVLMDIGMPRMDGYEAARRIRLETEGIRLIALTGWGQDLDRRKAHAAGFNTHFVKPVDLEQLLSTINE